MMSTEKTFEYNKNQSRKCHKLILDQKIRGAVRVRV